MLKLSRPSSDSELGNVALVQNSWALIAGAARGHGDPAFTEAL